VTSSGLQPIWVCRLWRSRLLHRKGYFRQRLNRAGHPREEPAEWDVEAHLEAPPPRVTINGRPIIVRAWQRSVTRSAARRCPSISSTPTSGERARRSRALTFLVQERCRVPADPGGSARTADASMLLRRCSHESGKISPVPSASPTTWLLRLDLPRRSLAEPAPGRETVRVWPIAICRRANSSSAWVNATHTASKESEPTSDGAVGTCSRRRELFRSRRSVRPASTTRRPGDQARSLFSQRRRKVPASLGDGEDRAPSIRSYRFETRCVAGLVRTMLRVS